MNTIKTTQSGEVLCGNASNVHFSGPAQHGVFLLPEFPLDLKSLLCSLTLLPAPVSQIHFIPPWHIAHTEPVFWYYQQ